MDAVVQLTDVVRRYGKVRALDGLSLRVEPGALYGFLGRNGAGKTTALRILMGILRQNSGEVRLFDEPVRKVGVRQKRRIGYVSQEQNFYPWMTALQLGVFVSRFYPTWDESEFQRMLALFDIPKDRRVAGLSGGTRTKLGLCLALAPRPDLLLLDEPTSGLDPVARREFNDLLAETVRSRGTTALLSSHLVDEIQHVATRIGIVQAGRMHFEGDLQGLLSSVRRVASLVPLVLPPGFTVLRGDVLRAPPEQWAAAAWPPEVKVSSLSLEEIFLAFARTDAVRAA